MAPGRDQVRYMNLTEVVRFVISTLIRWAQTKQYGELRIVCQGGQIEFVHESASYRGSVPRRDGQNAEMAAKVDEEIHRASR
jgi:hypothetical protein